MKTNYTVTIVKDELESFIPDLSLAQAKKLAKEEAKNVTQQVYISTYREQDGQTLYYNRDGFDCGGEAW